MIPAITARTLARVTIDLVLTAPSVLTGTADALVDVCGNKSESFNGGVNVLFSCERMEIRWADERGHEAGAAFLSACSTD